MNFISIDTVKNISEYAQPIFNITNKKIDYSLAYEK